MNTETKTHFSPWPYAIVIFFVLLAVYNVYIFRVASSSSRGYIEEDPFAKGFQYQSEYDAKQVLSRHGWKLEVAPSSTEAVSVRLTDTSKNSISNAAIVLKAVRPSDSSLDREFVLAFDGTSYRSAAPLPKAGLWYLRFEISVGDVVAVSEQQLYVK